MVKKIAILGAGISGLTAAWFLKKKFQDKVEIAIHEKNSRVGGWIQTLNCDGFLFETGPRGFRPVGRGTHTLALCEELGLKPDLVAANSASRIRYISQHGKLCPFSVPFLLRQGLLSAIVRDTFAKKNLAEDETIFDFICRRFNKRLAENILDPLARGVFGGDSRKLSMRSCFPTIWELEKKKGSVVKGLLRGKNEKSPVSLYSFKEGMETLPKKLFEKLDVSSHLSNEFHSLEDLDADLIISALPTPALAVLMKETDPIEYATLSTINCGWPKQVLNRKGYGFLVPAKEQASILGMTWDSDIFPEQNPEGSTRICVMVAGSYPKAALYQTATESLDRFLGIKEVPTVYSIHTAAQAIPQYTLNHFKRVEAFKKKFPPRLKAIGNWFGGVGINDCIFNAKKLADDLVF